MAEEQPLFASVEEATKKYKGLQRELEKSRKREKEAVDKRMDIDELKETMSLNARMLQTILEGSDISETNEGKPVNDLVAEAKSLVLDNKLRREMASALDEAGVEYSDLPTDVQGLYESGKVADAIAAVKKLNAGENIEDRVTAEVQRVLREKGHVDTGNTTGPGGIPTAPRSRSGAKG